MQSIDLLQTDCSVKIPFDFLIPELLAKELLPQFCWLLLWNRNIWSIINTIQKTGFSSTLFFCMLNDWFRDFLWSGCLSHLFDLLLLYDKIEISECFHDSKILIRSYQQKTWKGGLFCTRCLKDRSVFSNDCFFPILFGEMCFLYHRQHIYIHS